MINIPASYPEVTQQLSENTILTTLPIDVYIPGCPPHPEAILNAIIKLRKKISNESLAERGSTRQTHRYYTLSHQMKPLPTAHNGQYLRSQTREKPPAELAAAQRIPLPELLQQWQPQKTSEGSGS